MKRISIIGVIAVASVLLLFAGVPAMADDVVIDNYIGEANGDTAGAVGNFRKQSFTPNVAGLGALDTVGANSPLPASVFLDSAIFLRAVSGNSPAGAGDAFIDVYQGIGDGGTYLGSSLNSNDVDTATGLTALTWNFGGLAMDSTLEHSFVFSSDVVAGNPFEVRLQVARDAGGGFGSSYSGGTADNFSDGSAPLAFDTRFQVNFSTTAVPEPSTLALTSFGLIGFVKRRRRK